MLEINLHLNRLASGPALTKFFVLQALASMSIFVCMRQNMDGFGQ
jgi:hypothetical protein